MTEKMLEFTGVQFRQQELFRHFFELIQFDIGRIFSDGFFFMQDACRKGVYPADVLADKVSYGQVRNFFIGRSGRISGINFSRCFCSFSLQEQIAIQDQMARISRFSFIP